MQADGTNLQPPIYAPTYPNYPPLEQLLRVASGAAALAGTSPRIYPATVQQFTPPLSLRDRESAYLFEPNNQSLVGGYYDARLVGSYPPDDPAALPLYAVCCCPSAASSASSAAPH